MEIEIEVSKFFCVKKKVSPKDGHRFNLILLVSRNIYRVRTPNYLSMYGNSSVWNIRLSERVRNSEYIFEGLSTL